MFTIWSTKYWICRNWTFKIWLSELTDENLLSYDFSFTFSYCSFFSSKSSDAVFCFWESWKATEVNCELSTNREAQSTHYMFVYYLYQMCFISDRFLANVCMCSQAFKKAPDDPKPKYPTVSKCSYGELHMHWPITAKFCYQIIVCWQIFGAEMLMN